MWKMASPGVITQSGNLGVQSSTFGAQSSNFSNTSEDSNIVVLESSADSIPDNSCETAHGFSVSSDHTFFMPPKDSNLVVIESSQVHSPTPRESSITDNDSLVSSTVPFDTSQTKLPSVRETSLINLT